MFAISRAQSILSIGRSDCSVEVKVDVEGVTFCEGLVAMTLEPFFGLLLRKLGIRLALATGDGSNVEALLGGEG